MSKRLSKEMDMSADDKAENRNPTLRMVHFDIHEQSECDSFIRRISECKTPDEVREVVSATRKFYEKDEPEVSNA